MRVFRDVLRQNMTSIVMWLVFSLGGWVICLLYGSITEPVLYASILSLVLLLSVLIVRYLKAERRAAERQQALSMMAYDWHAVPEAESGAEEDYRQMIGILGERLERLTAQYEEQSRSSMDYYTAWVHQIKTPIAVMKLRLSEDTEEHRALSAELFRIEQYVDMVLQYTRLGSTSNDLVIREYAVDELVRETIRKYAPVFVGKKLKLTYEPVSCVVVTDRMWFTCILEQFISNAVKYTRSGTISIYVEDGRLVVEDTGIGIATEDLPRIFEKGYTGNNGRIGEKSSGLGLYLASKAVTLLKLRLHAESKRGEGSRFMIDLTERKG